MMKYFKLICLLVSLSQCYVFGAELPRVISAADKLIQVSRATEQLSSDLLQLLEQEAAGGNVFISGFSISTALAMLILGATNGTYAEVHNLLSFEKNPLSEADLLSGYKHLLNELNHPFFATANQLSVANALAIQKNEPILESFRNAVVGNFDAQLMVKDFEAQGKAATEELNAWVSGKTHGKISQLVDELDADTILVLLNAIYFKGTWESKFEKKVTLLDTFFITRETSEQVPLMETRESFQYAQFPDGQLLEIPYVNKTMSMFVLLPSDSHPTIPLSQSLSNLSLTERISQLYSTDVHLRLPKFKLEGSYSLQTVLKHLGMVSAFCPGVADFSRINGQRDLFVSEIVHESYIEVNEEGAEAAAATAIVFEKYHSFESFDDPISFFVNRPFLFFIRDNVHQLTLFSGVINNPK